MTINSKFKGLSAAAAAVSLFAITPARSGPVLPDRLELSTWRAPVEPAGYHWQRHYHQAYAADDYAAEELAMTALFWPLWSSDCCFGGCGWTVATDPGCYFYGCGAGWGLGPFAWGLFGLGFADPYGISGWGYSGLGYGEFGYPGFGGYGGVAGARFGAGLGAGLGTGVLAGRHFAGHHIGRGAHGFGRRHFAGWRGVHGRRFAGFHSYGGRHFGAYRGFGGRRFMAFHGGGFGGGFHGGEFGGFHGGGFHGGGFHGGGFHGGGRR